MGTPVLLSGHLCGKLSHSPRVELSLGFIVPIATFSAPQISDSSSGELPLLCAECGPQRVFSYSCFTLPFSGLHLCRGHVSPGFYLSPGGMALLLYTQYKAQGGEGELRISLTLTSVLDSPVYVSQGLSQYSFPICQ